MLRTASRVDANQASIVRTLRAVGASVLHVHQLKNCFDILVGYRGRTFLMEIKDPAQPPSARELTPGEAEFKATWRGSTYHVVHTPQEAIAIITKN
ncbi:hypothetical protein GO988_21610 [Hymenobacter sp. HMF4947]|uniref:VRR-NUC domain-containing protein n=1 Tax=Hymenobacter ginkgonis TaxID=2682976 RepID=A0A7K1TKK3_9BACT|nr:hypothetical protein [Hymenobacter ginkgonis]MVN78935.1 hypothetical protein [Hymenobacter ginkgonis]